MQLRPYFSVRRLAATLALGFAVSSASLAACGPGDDTQATLCVAGTEIFCNCPGGQESGVRSCFPDGSDFGECEVAPGTPCGDRVECVDGETIPCLCPDNSPGQKACLRDGTGYDSCKLDEFTPCPDPPDPVTTTGMGGAGPASSSSAGGAGQGGSTSTGGCAHDLCEEGDALSGQCDPCAEKVCVVDDYCCTTAWDSFCLATVDQQCDNLCTPAGECAHTPCEEGVALTDNCNPCVAEICAADPACCDAANTEWDALCVSAANNPATYPACEGVCGCKHSECVEGVKLDAECSACATAICGADDFCCENEWDQFCVQDAEASDDCNCPLE